MEYKDWNLGHWTKRIRLNRWRIIERPQSSETFHIKLSPRTAIDARAKRRAVSRDGPAHAFMPAAEQLAKQTDFFANGIVDFSVKLVRN